MQSANEAATTIVPICTEEETKTLGGKIICSKSAGGKWQNIKNLHLGGLLEAVMVS